FPVDDKPVDLVLNIDVASSSSGAYSNKLAGSLSIGSLKFSAAFNEDPSCDFFVATYSQASNSVDGQSSETDDQSSNGGKSSIDVKEFISEISSTVSAYIPEGIVLELKDIILAYNKTIANSTAETKFLFGFDVGTGINLSNLPLVGHEFPQDATIGVDDLQVMVASKLFNQSLVSQLNGLLPEGVTKLPSRDLSSGVGVSAMMNFGDSPNQLD